MERRKLKTRWMSWQRKCRSVVTPQGVRKAYRVPGTREYRRNLVYRAKYFAGQEFAEPAARRTENACVL